MLRESAKFPVIFVSVVLMLVCMLLKKALDQISIHSFIQWIVVKYWWVPVIFLETQDHREQKVMVPDAKPLK